MHTICSIELERAWSRDPEAGDIFGGRADVDTVESSDISIRVDEKTDLVELTVARFGCGDWVWDTPHAYGYAESVDAAKAAAMKRGWHEAMLRLREEVAIEVVEPLDKIAKTAADAVRNRRAVRF